IFDHPYQWGSKRTGPDLSREGGPKAKNAQGVEYKFMRSGLRGNDWHFNHFLDPRAVSEGSNMPAYPWLFDKDSNAANIKALPSKIAAQARLGVPWPTWNQHEIYDMVETQAQEIAGSLVTSKVFLPDQKELAGEELRNYLAKTKVVALIAFVQKLGTYRVVGKDGPAVSVPLNPDSYRAIPPVPPVPAPAVPVPAAPAEVPGTPAVAPSTPAAAPGTPAP
ncbi:MAG: cytochrome-c oxidase, cbb3-type subunit, partial [Verrucomicrobiota bacterium]